MIDFEKIETKELFEFKGGKGMTRAKIFADDAIKIMKMKFEPGVGLGIHTHETNSEIIYILEGTARCTLDGEVEILKAGQCHYCPKGHTHNIQCEGNETCVAFAIIPEQ